MRVEDGLACAGAGVEDDAVAATVDLVVGGDRSGLAQHVGGDLRFGGGERRGVRVVDLGNDQDVGRCLRVDVLEGDGGVALADDGRRDLPRDDLAEQAVGLRLSRHGPASSVGGGDADDPFGPSYRGGGRPRPGGTGGGGPHPTPAQPQRPVRPSSSAVAAVPAVEVRSTLRPSRYVRAPAAAKASSSWGRPRPRGRRRARSRRSRGVRRWPAVRCRSRGPRAARPRSRRRPAARRPAWWSSPRRLRGTAPGGTACPPRGRWSAIWRAT